MCMQCATVQASAAAAAACGPTASMEASVKRCVPGRLTGSSLGRSPACIHLAFDDPCFLAWAREGPALPHAATASRHIESHSGPSPLELQGALWLQLNQQAGRPVRCHVPKGKSRQWASAACSVLQARPGMQPCIQWPAEGINCNVPAAGTTISLHELQVSEASRSREAGCGNVCCICLQHCSNCTKQRSTL